MVKYAAAIDKSIQLEKKHGKQKWEELKNILIECGYPVKMESDTSLIIKLKDAGYIEVFYLPLSTDRFVHIELWDTHFHCKTNILKHYNKKTHQHGSLTSALNYINTIFEDIKHDYLNA